MKRLKADISHRIRRTRPSIFGTVGFRLLLGGGVAIVLALLVGPWLAWRLSLDAPFALGRFAPWVGVARQAEPVAVDRARSVVTGLTTPAGPGAGEASRRPSPGAALPSTVASAGPVASPAPRATPPATETAGLRGGGGAGVPGALYHVQLGAFLDPGNADRLVARLRAAGLGEGTSVVEQGRVRYRVMIPLPAGAAAADLEDDEQDSVAGRLRALGFTPEASEEGYTVTGPVPLTNAVETSRRLREEGMTVRLRPEAGTGTLRVVRVGAYTSAAEAEQARVALASRGFEGMVVRER